MKKTILPIVLMFLCSCTVIRETEIYNNFLVDGQPICIKKTKSIRYKEFNDVLLEETEKRGFIPKFVDETKGCQLVMEYDAIWEWDVAYYINDATIDIYKGETLMASSKYHVTAGSWNMAIWKKYRKAKTIVGDMLDEIKDKLSQQERI